jgi:hypothetical protein
MSVLFSLVQYCSVWQTFLPRKQRLYTKQRYVHSIGAEGFRKRVCSREKGRRAIDLSTGSYISPVLLVRGLERAT